MAEGCPPVAKVQRRLAGTLPTLSHQGRVCAALLPTDGAERVPAPDPLLTLGKANSPPESCRSDRPCTSAVAYNTGAAP